MPDIDPDALRCWLLAGLLLCYLLWRYAEKKVREVDSAAARKARRRRKEREATRRLN